MQPTLEQPVTEEGRWELDPGGAWILVEPSAEWLAERDAAPDPVDPNTDLPADPDLIPPDPTRLRSPR